MTISGTSFCDGAMVKFGPDEATSVVVISPQEIRAVTPMHFPTDCRLDYQVPVRVMNPDGSSGSRWGFTYHPSHILEVGRPGAGKPYTSIQAAIDAAGEGDAVVIDPAGEGFDFVESFDTKGKKIFITSSDPNDRPVIAAATGKVLTIKSGEGPQTVIACLALISGTGGILIDAGSSPTIIDNEIHDHITSGDGGGILIKGGSSPLIQDNLIHTNLARHGGGIAVLGAGTAPTLVANEIRGNEASGDGGGIYIETGTKVAGVRQCSIHENSAGRGGGIYCGRDLSANPSSRQIRADDIFGNRCATSGAGVFVAGGAKVEILESAIHDNVADGNGGGLACDGSQTTGTDVLVAASHIERNQAQGPCGMGGGCGRVKQTLSVLLSSEPDSRLRCSSRDKGRGHLCQSRGPEGEDSDRRTEQRTHRGDCHPVVRGALLS